MLRYFNRIQQLSDDRLPELMFNHELSMNRDGWLKDVGIVTRLLGLSLLAPGINYDLQEVRKSVYNFAQERWWKDTLSKPKLRTYVQMRDKNMEKSLVKVCVERYQRSILF